MGRFLASPDLVSRVIVCSYMLWNMSLMHEACVLFDQSVHQIFMFGGCTYENLLLFFILDS